MGADFTSFNCSCKEKRARSTLDASTAFTSAKNITCGALQVRGSPSVAEDTFPLEHNT